MAHVQISSLLEKMTSPDKDFRFMAANDLMTELEKEALKLDEDTERRITKALLCLIDDKNGEVQNLAVKCLAPLVVKAKPPQVELMLDGLITNVESDKERLRDASSIALKTVVNEISPASHNTVQIVAIINKIVPKLLTHLESKTTESSVKIEITDILGLLITKFGRHGLVKLSEAESALFSQLGLERQALRKRIISVIGILVDAVNDEAYERIAGRILNGLKEQSSADSLRAYVLAAATISKSSTRLFAKFLPEIVGLLSDFCRKNTDDELTDACIHAFEMFINRCGRDVSPFINDIQTICAEFIQHDPNYQYDDDDVEEMEVDGDEELEEYSDDDDFSWKVRRSAAKCLEALILNRSDCLLEHYKTISPLLLSRFKEREESVKLDIFRAYDALLKQTRLFLPESLSQLETSFHQATFSPDSRSDYFITNEKIQKILAEEVDEKQQWIIQALVSQVPSLVKAIIRQLKFKSSAVHLQCFSLLVSLVKALPGALTEHFDALLPSIKSSFSTEGSDVSTTIDTLHFLDICFCSHEVTIFKKHWDLLIKLVCGCVTEQFYKVGSVALLVLQSLIVVLKETTGGTEELPKYVEPIYQVVIGKLKMNDIDQEVKERAIACTGIMIGAFGPHVSHHLHDVWPLLLDRLHNEMTRHITVQTFGIIISAKDPVDLSPVMLNLFVHFSDFLKKNQRALKVSTLNLLSSLITKYPSSELPTEGVATVIGVLPTVMAEQDLYVSQLSLRLCRDVMLNASQCVGNNLEQLIESCIQLTSTSILVGKSLQYAVELFVAIVKSDTTMRPDFMALIDRLTTALYSSEKASRQVCNAVAVIVANSVKANSDLSVAAQIIDRLQKLLATTDSKNENLQIFALYALGELGRVYPECFTATSVQPDALLIQSFNALSEDVKAIASHALGALTTGDVSRYLPSLLKQIKEEPKRQYLLLHALKEVVANQSSGSAMDNVFKSEIDGIWTVLLNHSKCAEESTRNVVAECMGKMCRIEPTKFLPSLITLSKNGNQMERGAAATAVRFMIVDSSRCEGDKYLQMHLAELLQAIDDGDLNVRRTAIMTLNSAAHNRPRWIKDILPNLLRSLYRETAVRQELIHEVEMGPFKHVVDDGLDLRKSAYECMYTLMEHCLDRLDVLEYMGYIEAGLKDQHDIRLLNLLMLTRLSQTCSSQVAGRIDAFVELITPLLSLKPRANSVKQESDKVDEMKRAAIRTILALKRLSILDRSTKLNEAYEFIHSDSVLKAMMESIEKDSSLKLLSLQAEDVHMENDF